MALCAALVLSALYYLLLLAWGGYSNAEDLIFEQVRVSSFLPSASCSQLKAGGGNSIKMVNRHGPCSGTPTLTEQNKLDALAHDASRFAWIQERVGGTTVDSHSVISGSQGSIPLRNGLYIGTGEHVITVAYGTPARTKTVIFDTGNNWNWIQCKGCERCYSQKEPLFDPALSSTYRNVSYDSPLCPSSARYGSTCAYLGPDTDAYTIGFLATETFTLSPGKVFRNFLFGCSQYYSGNFGQTAGVVGFGRRNYTLNVQVAKRLGNVFSYCFPSTSSSTGFLNFGKPLKKPLGYTPMVTNPLSPAYYFIDLIGISVGGTRLSLSPNVFQLTGTLIDSGMVNTYLPVKAYSELRAAFRAGMTQYKMARAAGRLDTCYDFSKTKTVLYPAIKLHFTGLDVEIPRSGVFNTISPSQACLAFIGSPGFGVVGSLNLKTYELTYDAARERIGFSAGACG